jgi:hypothetical protein
MDPAIKKQIEHYRGLLLGGPEDAYSMNLQPKNLTAEEVFRIAYQLVMPTMFGVAGGGYYYIEPAALEIACDCFRMRDGSRFDLENPLQQRLLLWVLAHVVFGKSRKRGRVKDDSKHWTILRGHQLAVLYLDIKSKHPELSNTKIAEQIASIWRMPGSVSVIRKRLSEWRGWIERLKKLERERPGAIKEYTELLKEGEMAQAKRLAPFKLSG